MQKGFAAVVGGGRGPTGPTSKCKRASPPSWVEDVGRPGFGAAVTPPAAPASVEDVDVADQTLEAQIEAPAASCGGGGAQASRG